MENLRNRINVNLVRCREENRIRKLIARPSFAKAKTFDHDLAATHMYRYKTNLNLIRPVYAGMSILDLSKHLMYDLYYNHLKTKYGDKCNLIYTDTDTDSSLRTAYADMVEEKDLYDFTNYPKDHPLYSE